MAYNDNPFNGVFDESAARGTATPVVDTSYLPTPSANDLAARTNAPINWNDPFYQRSDLQAIYGGANPTAGQLHNRTVTENNGIDPQAHLTANTWTGKHPVGTLLAAIALAGAGAAAAGAAGAGAGAGGAGSGVGMTAGGGALSSDAALGAAANAGVGTFGAGAAGAGAAGAGAAGAGAALGAGSAADAALPEILVQGTVPAASSGGLFAGAGDAALGALANSQVGQAPTSGGSSNPFTSFLTDHAGDIAQLGLGVLGGGGVGGGGNGGGQNMGTAGVMPNYGSGYTDANGAPLSSLSFPRSGFRDQGAFDYLLQSLGLPSPGAQAASAPPAPAPSGLDNFAGMDFSSVFQGLVNPNSGSFGIPSPTAQASGTRGPDPSALGTVNDLAGTFGNGGAAIKTTPTNPWIKLSRISSS